MSFQLQMPQPISLGVLNAASAAFSAPAADGSNLVINNNGGAAMAGIQLWSAAFVGTVDFEGTVDGLHWFGLSPANDQSIEPARTLSGASNLFYQLDIAGLASFLVRCTAFTSGALTVSAQTSNAQGLANSLFGHITTTVLALLSRTATANSGAIMTHNARRMTLVVNVTDATGGGSITPSLQIQDSQSGAWITVWQAAAALATNGERAYHFDSGASGDLWTEVAFFGVPARTIRWQCIANNASPIIYDAVQDLLL